MSAFDKRLNEMDRLADMGQFPAAVNAGATLNVLLTVSVTWWIVPRYPQPFAPVLWIALVLCVNLLPVILLRLTLRPDVINPTLRTMDFVRDQHKFSDWVYVVASANMAFWVLGAWALFSVFHTVPVLVAVLSVALVLRSPRCFCGAVAPPAAMSMRTQRASSRRSSDALHRARCAHPDVR